MIPVLVVGLLACDTVRRANTEEEALANCEVIAALAVEHCAPEDPTFAIHCVWRSEFVYGRAPTPPMTDCLVWACSEALDVAEQQCERGSLARFQRGRPEVQDTGACCGGPGPGCEISVGCY